MKVQVFLPVTIVVSVLLVVLINVRQEEKEKQGKRATFMAIKLRVSEDVLREYANEKVELKQDIETAKKDYEEIDKDRKATQEAADKARLDAEKCAEEQVRGARTGAAGEEKGVRSLGRGRFCPAQGEELPLKPSL